METLGGRLWTIRNHRGLTLQGLAEHVDCSAGFLSKVERNESGLSLDMAVKLAQALNVRVGVLVGAEPLVGDLFTSYLRALSAKEKFTIETMPPEERMAMVVRWMGRTFPELYSQAQIARQMGITPDHLNEVLEGRQEFGGSTFLERLVAVTGIPSEFFGWGFYPGVTPSGQLPPALATYGPVLEEAAVVGIPPQFLRKLIQAWHEYGIGSAVGQDQLALAMQVLGRMQV